MGRSGWYILLVSAWLMGPGVGCRTSGPLQELGVLRKPYRESAYGPTPLDKLAELDHIAARARSLSQSEQQTYSENLAEKAANEKNKVLRLRVIKTLGAFQTSQATEAIAKAISDDDPDIRIAAIRATAGNRSADLIAPLAERVQGESNDDVRLAAVRALGEFRDPKAIQALGIALNAKNNPAIQYRAMQSLRTASGRDYGYDLVAWKQFAQGDDPTPAPTSYWADRLPRVFR